MWHVMLLQVSQELNVTASRKSASWMCQRKMTAAEKYGISSLMFTQLFSISRTLCLGREREHWFNFSRLFLLSSNLSPKKKSHSIFSNWCTDIRRERALATRLTCYFHFCISSSCNPFITKYEKKHDINNMLENETVFLERASERGEPVFYF